MIDNLLCFVWNSLDPEHDPMGIFLMIDFYAIRSEQYDFLVRMYEEWDAHRNLSQLPQFCLLSSTCDVLLT